MCSGHLVPDEEHHLEPLSGHLFRRYRVLREGRLYMIDCLFPPLSCNNRCCTVLASATLRPSQAALKRIGTDRKEMLLSLMHRNWFEWLEPVSNCRQGCHCFGLCGPHQFIAYTAADMEKSSFISHAWVANTCRTSAVSMCVDQHAMCESVTSSFASPMVLNPLPFFLVF